MIRDIIYISVLLANVGALILFPENKYHDLGLLGCIMIWVTLHSELYLKRKKK